MSDKDLKKDIAPYCQVARCCYNEYIEQVFEINELEEENKVLRECLMEAMEIQENWHSDKLKETYEKVKRGEK